MSVLKGFLLLTIESIIGWLRQNAILYASSLAYFTIFSLAPLILLTTAIPSFIFGSSAVEEQLIALTEMAGGTALTGMVTEILHSSNQAFRSGSGPIIALISLGVILFGASLVFRQLQLSINVMWGLEVEPLTPKREDLWRNGLMAARKFLISTVAALAGGFLLLVTLLSSAAGSALMQLELLTTTLAQVLVSLLNFVAVPVAYTLIFACIFKYLPQGRLRWRDLWPGTIITALLFWLAGYGISVYLTYGKLDSAFGAASSLFGFLIWVFTATSIILFGAKFIQLYAARYGVPIVPEQGMTLKPPPPLVLPRGVTEWLKQ